MNAVSFHSSGLPFNPEILLWAREWRGKTLAEAAKKIAVAEDKIEAWETGKSRPTVRQARNLASFYDRSFLEFFLDRPPNLKESDLVPDFRLHKHADDPRGDREIMAIQSWAEEMRLNALDLFDTLGDAPPTFPKELYANLDSNPEMIAKIAREQSGFSIDDQFSLTSQTRYIMPRLVRRSLERLGVLVLKESALAKYAVRGLCVFSDPLPVVVFSSESPAAQAFTMGHELGHIILQQSAISGQVSARDDSSQIERAERWCDKFSAAFLIPADAIAARWAKPNFPQAAIGDNHLAQLANAFAVSRHAMLVRLVHLGYVEDAYYWDIKRPEFLEQEADYKGGGRPSYYGSRFRSTNGDLYTGLVLEAWNNGDITNHNAAELMGTKSLQHLYDIRENFET